MTIIAVVQQKGGSGRTTMATNLAAVAHLEGKRALVVDLDPQGSAFEWADAREGSSLLDGLVVVRADKALAPKKFADLARGFDVVLLDAPPGIGEITQAAVIAADTVVIPVQPGPYDIWSCAKLIKVLDSVDVLREQMGKPMVRRCFVLNRADAREQLTREAEAEMQHAGGELAGVIRQRTIFRKSAARGEAVMSVEPNGDAALEMRRLWKTLRRTAGEVAA